jgi:hypothetical protein
MKQIDFLPDSYRDQTVHRKANVWRVLVAALFAALLGGSACYQQLLRHNTARELGRIGSQYDQAQLLSAKLATLKQRLQDADAEADLLTYLRHPWPSTRVLAAALGPLPDCITLGEIRLTHEHPDNASVQTVAASPALKKPTEADAAADAKRLSAAARDLALLREQHDNRPTVLLLAGVTTDTAGLQRYLVTLAEVQLFSKAELTSLEAEGAERPGALRFTARLLVRPGYCQPGGPTISREEKPAAGLAGEQIQTDAPAKTSPKNPGPTQAGAAKSASRRPAAKFVAAGR